MPEMGVTFNGIDLTKWITVIDGFTALGGGDFAPALEDYSVTNGSEFSYTRKAKKTIKVPFYVKYDSISEYDAFQRALNVSEPKRLEFSYLTNRYFLAIPTGDLDFDEIKISGKGTISFVVPDGVGHAKNTAQFEFQKNDYGIMEALIVNNGSEAVPISYDVTFEKETGYLGIISKDGAMQFGKAEEADGYMAEKSVIVTNNRKGNFDSWRNGSIFYENRGKKVVTTMESTSSKDWLGILPQSFVNTDKSYQFGACKELEIAEPGANWYLWARAWFETATVGQTGAWCLTVLDEKKQLIAGMALEKNDTVGNTAQVRFLVGDGKGGSKIQHEINFEPSYWVNPNPYGNEAADQNRNMFDIRKEADKVTFYWYGSYFPYIIPALKDVKAKKLQFYIGQYNGRNTVGQLITRHYLSDLVFTRLNVPYWKDVPNRYPAGSNLVIDGKEGKFYANGKWMPDDEILGTKYFKAPPGKTKVQLVTSTWSDIASATATIEEAYL